MAATREAAGARAKKPLENRAWILLFISSVILAVVGIIVLALVVLTGSTFSIRTWGEVTAFSPGLAPFVAYSGMGILGLGVFGAAITAFSFKKGERWAWFVLWYLPAFALVGEITDLILLSGHAYSYLIVAFLSVAGLLLSFRKFFPRKG